MKKKAKDLDPGVTQALLVAGVLASDEPVDGGTAFARLSEEAQGIIVDMVLGGDPPADLSDELRQEIVTWCDTDEDE